MSKREELEEKLKSLSPAQREALLRKMRERQDRPKSVSGQKIGRHDYGAEAPVSSDQRRMWFLQQLDPQSVAYHVPVVARLEGPLDLATLRDAVRGLIARHEVLRTVYPDREGEPYQSIRDVAEPVWRTEDVTDEASSQAAAQQRLEAEIARPFDLKKEPPLRVTVLEVGADEHILLLLFHHIAIDEWTTGVLLAELSELYSASSQGRGAALAPLALQYADYAIWQQEQLSGAAFEEGLDFWGDLLQEAPRRIEWPMGEEPSTHGHPAEMVEFIWDEAISERVGAFAKQHKASTFALLQAAFTAFLARYTGQRDLVIGVPVTMRHRPELQGLVGFLLNTVPARARVSIDEGFADWFERSQREWRETGPHQWIPLEEIVRSVGATSEATRSPLFDTFFTFVPGGSAPGAFAGLEVRTLDMKRGREAKTALSVGMGERDGRIAGVFTYDAARFGHRSMSEMVDQFQHFVRNCLNSPQRPMGAHDLVVAEQIALLDGWSRGSAVDVSARPFHELFERLVVQHPERTALRFLGGQWSYAQLNSRANDIAQRLGTLGVGPETPIGVCAERSPELIATLFGVMKAGGTYVALDPSLPPQRLQYIASDGNARLVLCDDAGLEAMGAGGDFKLIDIGEVFVDGETTPNPHISVEPEQLVYVLYTSGTTGQPKGVMIPHRALTNLAQCFAQLKFGGDARERVFLLKASYGFDMFAGELFPVLAGGGCVAVAPSGAEQEPDRLGQVIRELEVTDIRATPTNLRLLLDSQVDVGERLLAVYSGGEALTAAVCRAIQSQWGVRLWNFYGPTEMCCAQTSRIVEPGETLTNVAHIGRATPNHLVTILDEFGGRSPGGVDGEIVIAGMGEARGYNGMARRTALAFVPSPVDGRLGARMYCSGDIGRWSEQGQIGYRGRRDDQVQVRGVRIELSEIEAHLEQVAGVSRAAVRAADETAGRTDALIAYVVPKDPAAPPEVAALREHLAQHVAAAVIPGLFLFLDSMPTTSTGKIDRRALPDPDSVVRAGERVLPRTATEERVAEVWRERLGHDELSIDDNFFEVGGHSLLAVRLQRDLELALGVSFPLVAVLNHPTIARFAAWVERGEGELVSPITRHQYGDEAPVSSEQRRMWFLQELDRQSVAYHVPVVARLQGPLDLAALQDAVRDLTARHEVLRTVYPERDGEPYQSIRDTAEPVWRAEDLTDEDSIEAALQQSLAVEIARPFDLKRDLPLRVTVLEVGKDEHILLLLFHHIAIDEWTNSVLLAELSELYSARSEGRGAQLPPLPLQYADYAIWQTQRLEGEAFEASLSFWREHLEGVPDSLDWPVGDEPSTDAHPAGSVHFSWGEALSERLREAARRHGATLFSVLHAAFAAYLARVTAQGDVTVGLPTTMRQRPELQGLVGFLLNTVPMRSRVATDASFEQWLEQSVGQWNATAPHQWVPLEEIVQAVGAKRRSGGLPLFDVMFTYVPGVPAEQGFGGMTLEPLDFGGLPDAKVTLSVSFGDSGACLNGSFEYDGARLSRSDVEGLVEQFERFVASCLAAPTQPLAAHPLLGETERAESLALGTGPTREIADETVYDRFVQRATESPERIALHHRDGQTSYGELFEAAQRVSVALVELGVEPGDVVGVCAQRSPELVAAILGVLATGCAYLPLQPDLPSDRLLYMVDIASAAVVLCDDAGLEAAPWEVSGSLRTILNTPRGQDSGVRTIDSASAAYVLFTSGSTGRPKGVVVPHRALSSQIDWIIDEHRFTSDDVFYQKTPVSFDASVWEFFASLSLGAQLCLGSEEAHRDVEEMIATIDKFGVTVLQLVPTQLAMLLIYPEFDGSRLPSLQHVFCGGEALEQALVEEFHARFEAVLHNLYGPTEVCINSTVSVCARSTDVPVFIGGPVANTNTYVLDPSTLDLRGTDTFGELYIAGEQLAQGYVNRPGLTAERFLPDPFGSRAGSRMYRSGDLVRWSSGERQLAYYGRSDQQVKFRGHRIEPGEIESVIERHPAVERAVVTVWKGEVGAESLIAHVYPAAGWDSAEIEALCGASLPHYMVPAQFLPLDELPLTASGKVDRGALSALAGTQGAATQRVAPTTSTEIAIAKIWRERLGLDEVGIHENFFQVGGHSLLAVRLQRDLEAALGVSVPLAAVLDHSTIAQFASWIQRGEGESISPITRHEYGDEAPVSSDQRRMWFLQKLRPDSVAYAVPIAVRLPGALNVDALRHAMAGLIARHEVLRTVYPERDGEPVQRILPPEVEVPWTVLDVSSLENPEAEAKALFERSIARPFDLERDLSLRVTLIKLGELDYGLLLLFHHIAIDEWTTGVVLAELAELYKAAHEGRVAELEQPLLQYADYALWQAKRIEGDAFEEGIAFWRTKLDQATARIEWPIGEEQGDDQAPAGSVKFRWSPGTSELVRNAARTRGLSGFITLYAAFAAFVSRVTGQTDLVMGLPVTMRERPELQGLVGFLLNTVPMRSTILPSITFEQWLRQIQANWLEASKHHWIPLDRIVRALAEQAAGASVPFETMFTFVPAPPETDEWAGLKSSALDMGELPEAKAPLILAMSELDGCFAGSFAFDASRFDAADIERLARQFERFVRACLQEPERVVMDVEVLDPSELPTVLRWSAGETMDVAVPTWPEQFLRRAAMHPERTALQYDGRSWSYGELQRRADALARELVARGVRAETTVGVSVARSDELIVALLGVLLSGGAYVALEPSLPSERLHFMAEDANVRIVVCDPDGAAAFAQRGVDLIDIASVPIGKDLDEGWRPRIDPEQLAYVLYTSGTTGRPKGVMISHRALANLSDTYARRVYEIAEDEEQRSAMVKASYTFDMFVAELFPWLCAGARVVVAPAGAEREPDALMRVLVDGEVTDLWATPTHLRLMLEGSHAVTASRLRRVYSGGEALSSDVCEAVMQRWGVEVFNLYGPTEMCVGQTWQTVRKGQSPIPIGRATPNHEVAILDPFGHRSGPAITGEIVIAGRGEGRGYLGMAAQTAKTFLPCANGSGGGAGARMYCTGDRGQWDEDGAILYLGRNDEQLQVRGVRIELTELEGWLSAAPGVAHAAILPVNESAGRADGLIGYVVAVDPANPPTSASLREHLGRRFAETVIPGLFLPLERLPTSPSGKLDRRALAQQDHTEVSSVRVLPRTELERQIAQIWADQMGLDAVGVHENFFEIGGHSLLAVQVRRRLEEATGSTVPLELFFRKPTVAQLASYLEGEGASIGLAQSVVSVLREGSGPIPVVLIHPVGGSLFAYRELVRQISAEVEVLGIQSPVLVNDAVPPGTVDALARLYARELSAFRKLEKVVLGGWSFGGVVAVEMVRALEEHGIEVSHLVLLDAHHPGLMREAGELSEFESFAVDLAATLQIPGEVLLGHRDEFAGLGEVESIDRLAEVVSVGATIDPELLRSLYGAYRIHVRALRGHRPAKVSVRATVFAAETGSSNPPDRGWTSVLGENIRVVRLPTDHYGLMRQPHVHIAAGAFNAVELKESDD